SENDLVRICAARALRSLGSTPEVFKALGGLLSHTNSFVQAEACRSLISTQFKGDRVVPMLLKALSLSNPRGGGAGNIMQPVQNFHASGRAMIIYALTHF